MLMQDSKALVKHEVFQHATIGDFIGSNFEGISRYFLKTFPFRCLDLKFCADIQ